MPVNIIGLLVRMGGYAICYYTYEGGTYEGRKLIRFFDKIGQKFDLGKPITAADAVLLSIYNILVSFVCSCLPTKILCKGD
jgi:hypothetical protein